MLATIALAANALQLRPLILLVARHFSIDAHKDIVVGAPIDPSLRG